MKGLIYVTLALAVMGLGFWAYQENYYTQAALRDVRELRSRINVASSRLDRLNAEWAYLNRPDRLLDLVELNFDRLELLPIAPDVFAQLDQVAYPPTTLGPIVGAIATSSDGTRPWEEPL